MKRQFSLSLCLLAILVAAAPLKAQMVEERLGRNFLYASPFHFFDGNVYLGLERFNKTYQRSFVLNTGFVSKANDKRTAGILIQPEIRKYYLSNFLNNDTAGIDWKLKGVYAGIFLHYSYLHEDYRKEFQTPTHTTFEYINAQYQSYAIGTSLGLVASIYKWLHVNFYVGGGIKFTDIKDPDPTLAEEGDVPLTSPAYEGIFPRVGAQIGINF
ncbi:MAG: hypothetical protein WD077_07600 [Bacteroidia bacterium]